MIGAVKSKNRRDSSYEFRLSAQRNLDRCTIRAPRHQAILEPGSFSELAYEHHTRNRQSQNDNQSDQRGRSPLIGTFIAIPRSVFHQSLRATMAKAAGAAMRAPLPHDGVVKIAGLIGRWQSR
jgi:hypothetical protein